MKVVLWSVFAVMALVWTGGAVLVAELVQWSAQAIAQADGAAIGAAAAGVQVPAWLGPWIDVERWVAVQQWVAGALAAASDALPAIGAAAGWLVPVVWVAWGVGLIVLVGLAWFGTWLIGRAGRPPTGPLAAAA